MLLQGYKSKWEIGIRLTLIIMISSLVLNLMKLNSYSIIGFLFFSFLTFRFFKKPSFDLLGISSLCYFGITLIGLFFTTNIGVESKNIESKLLLFILPLLYAFYGLDKRILSVYVFKTLLYSVSIVSVFCLVYSLVSFWEFRDLNLFFYHDLLKPIQHHAVYFSIGVILCIIYLITNKDILRNRSFLKISWIAYLWIILLLLSSKMLIFFAVVFLLAIQFKKIRSKNTGKWILGLAVLLIALFSFKNPISQRFYEIANSNLQVISQETIGPEVYLNGLEFRLLQWRNTYEILNRYDAWLTGVGFADSKKLLWEQYDILRLYKGEDPSVIGGFYVYDLHNQYLQTTLQMGILGLLVLVLFMFSLFKAAIQTQNILLLALACMFVFLCFTENVLDRQYGMIFFVFIPFLLNNFQASPTGIKKESN